MTDPVLAALDRLNGHARAFGCGQKAIYVYKRLFALFAADRGELSARPIGTVTKCGGCDGTGRFKFFDGGDAANCRQCDSRGYVRLRFVETTIGTAVWHHPWHRGGDDILRVVLGAEIFAVSPQSPFGFYDTIVMPGGATRPLELGSPGDWRPRAGGKRLAAEDAARDLNTVEAWVLDQRSQLRWDVERAVKAVSSYHLEIGQVGGPCWRCGSANDLVQHGIGHMGKRLHFSVRECSRCGGLPRVWPQEKDCPPHALTPAIRAWLDRPERKMKKEAND